MMDGEVREGTFYLNDDYAPSLKMRVTRLGDGFVMQNESQHGTGPTKPVREGTWAVLEESPQGEVW